MQQDHSSVVYNSSGTVCEADAVSVALLSLSCPPVYSMIFEKVGAGISSHELATI